MKTTPLTLARFVFILGLGFLSNPIFPWHASEALAESFNAKPGAWEMTYTGLSSGMMMPPEVLAKMPPEQRARIEQSMHARSATPGTHATKSCITKEDLDQNRIIKEEAEDEPGCTTKVLSKSSSKMVLERACPSPRAYTSRMAMEAKTPETLVASIDMDRAGSGKTHIDIKGRWLGTSCAGIAD
ncbi:MAG: DUF3617 domain-containing protein [Nitrospira sp.]|jgi:hypothetical protein|nr:DUF3617 domain-containing protein [Nitrospira sp.]